VHRPVIAFLLALFLSAGAWQQLRASSSVHEAGLPDLPALVAHADWIADFEILETTPLLRPDGTIATQVVASSRVPLKGRLASVQEFTLPGGAVAGRGLHIPGMPALEAGDRVLLFLSQEDPEARWRLPVGLSAGTFRVLETGDDGPWVVGAARSGPDSPLEALSYDEFLIRVQQEVLRQREG